MHLDSPACFLEGLAGDFFVAGSGFALRFHLLLLTGPDQTRSRATCVVSVSEHSSAAGDRSAYAPRGPDLHLRWPRPNPAFSIGHKSGFDVGSCQLSCFADGLCQD